MVRPEDGGLRRHAKSIFGERSIPRERLFLFGAKRHRRDLGYHLCSKELEDFERPRLTRSAVFLIFLIVVLTIGNHHVFKGPGDLNGHGCFCVRLHRTREGRQANIVEEDVLLSALSNIFAGLKRTWDQKLQD